MEIMRQKQNIGYVRDERGQQKYPCVGWTLAQSFFLFRPTILNEATVSICQHCQCPKTLLDTKLFWCKLLLG